MAQQSRPQYGEESRDLENPRLLLTFAAGLNENQTPDINEASSGYNFELGARQTKFIPRACYDLEGTAPNSSKVTSIMQLVTRANVKTTLVCAGTVVYSWTGGSGFTNKGAVIADALLRDTYWSLGDYLVVTDINLNNVVKKWDGTTFGNLTTGLGSPFYAKYSVVFLNRVWYFNITCGTVTPHMILASTFEDPQALDLTKRGGPTDVGGASSFSTGLEPFYLLTPDLKPINGVAVFQNILVVSTTDGKLFKLTGTDSKTFNFVEFYVGSSAIGNESVVNIGNDVIYVRKGGNINLLTSTQNFGDVKSNDVSRWIPDTVVNLTGAMTIYDQSKQKVYFFVPGKVLVLFKDILFGGSTDQAVNSGLSPWSVYTTTNPNNFNTSAAKYMQHPDSTDYSVYWGDASGNVYDINGVGTGGDAGSYPVDCKRKSRLIDVSVMNPFPYMESILVGKVQFRRKAADSQLSLSFEWSDEFVTSTSTVTLKGPSVGDIASLYNRASYFGGGAYWNRGDQLVNVISHQTFSPSGKGPGFYLTLQVQTTSAFQVDHIELM